MCVDTVQIKLPAPPPLCHPTCTANQKLQSSTGLTTMVDVDVFFLIESEHFHSPAYSF